VILDTFWEFHLYKLFTQKLNILIFNALTSHMFIKKIQFKILKNVSEAPLAFSFDQYITPQLMWANIKTYLFNDKNKFVYD
jgi:hypothetical protein